MQSFHKEISQNRVTVLKSLSSLPSYTLITPEHESFPTMTFCDFVIFFLIRVYNHPSTISIEKMLEKFLNTDSNHKTVFFYIEDFYNVPKINQFCQKYGVKNVIFSIRHEFYKKKLLSYDKSYNVSFFEHYFSLDMFPCFYTNHKKYDILFYGNSISYYYPLRDYLKKIFVPLKDEFRIKVIPLKSYERDESSVIQNNLYDEISKAHITVACTSKFDFFVKKYQEIPLSGSMILGNIPSDYEDILSSDDIIYVDLCMDEKKIVEKVRSVLADPEKMQTKVKNVQDRFQKLFSLSQADEHLQSILKKV
jgi:hypothetical protein